MLSPSARVTLGGRSVRERALGWPRQESEQASVFVSITGIRVTPSARQVASTAVGVRHAHQGAQKGRVQMILAQRFFRGTPSVPEAQRLALWR
jgi:hypothetical protein